MFTRRRYDLGMTESDILDRIIDMSDAELLRAYEAAGGVGRVGDACADEMEKRGMDY